MEPGKFTYQAPASFPDFRKATAVFFWVCGGTVNDDSVLQLKLNGKNAVCPVDTVVTLASTTVQNGPISAVLDSLNEPGLVTSSLFSRTIAVDYRWAASPVQTDSGTKLLPGVPHQIVYDPPGNGSTAALSNSSSFGTTVTTKLSMNAGLTAAYGVEYDMVFAKTSTEVSSNVKYTRMNDSAFSATVTHTSAYSTSGASGDASMVGPGQGDLFDCVPMLLHWQLYRAYAPGDKYVYSNGYVYRLKYAILPNPTQSNILMTAAQLKGQFAGNDSALNSILGASAIDPATHRVRNSLRDPKTGNPIGTRLVKISDNTLLNGGGAVVSQSYDSTVSSATTTSWDLELGTEIEHKVTIGGASAKGKLSFGVSVGSGSGSSLSSTRTVSSEITDAQPWNAINYRTYFDRAFGVYVFDVDSANSWTSFPYEPEYSKSAIRISKTLDHDTLAAVPGQSRTFKLTLSNDCRNVSTLDTVKGIVISAIQTSGANVSIDPTQVDLVRNKPITINVTVSATDTGMRQIVLNLAESFLGSGMNQAVPLALKVGENPTTGVALEGNGWPAFMQFGGLLRIRCASGESWTVVSRDLSGRIVTQFSGTGSQDVPLAKVHGVVVNTLSLAGRSQQLRTAQP